MELCEAIGRMRDVADGPLLASVDVDALRILLSAVTRVTTLVACVKCGQGVRWRYAVKEMCPDCAAAAIDRLKVGIDMLTKERDVAILRQVMYEGDGSGRDAWTIEGANSSGWAEKRGPYRRQEAAIAAVLAWVRYEVDPDAPLGPTEDGEGDDE